MKLTSVLKLSLTNLKRRKLRSFLTILGVSIGIGVLFFLLNSAQSLKTQIYNFSTSLTNKTRIDVSAKFNFFQSNTATSSASSQKNLTDDAIKKFRSLTHVKAAYPRLSVPANISLSLINPKTASSSAVLFGSSLVEDKDESKIVYGNSTNYIEQGSFFTSNETSEVIVPKKLATKLKISTGDEVKIEISTTADSTDPNAKTKKIATLSSKVIGIIKDPPPGPGQTKQDYDNALPAISGTQILTKQIIEVSPVDTGQGALRKGEYYAAEVFVDDIKNVREVESEIKKQDYDTSSVFSLADQLNIFFLILEIIMAAISSIGILISLIGISNTMYMSVLERTREIGILKALGASSRDISRLFTAESALIGFLGAVVGIIFASLVGFIAAEIGNFFLQAQLEKSGIPPGVQENFSVRFIIDPKILIGVIIFSIIMAVVAGFFPARRAAKLDPIQALKYE